MGIIGSIRKHSGVAVAIVGLAIVAFIIGDLTKQRGGIPDVGKIAGQTITRQHFDAANAEMQERYRAQGVTQFDSEMESRVRQATWMNILEETLYGVEMNKLGISVTAEEMSDMYLGDFIDPQLRQMFTDPQTGQFNTQQVKYWIDNFQSLDTAQQRQWVSLERDLKRNRATSKYLAMVHHGFYMPNAIAKQIANLSTTSNDVRVAMVPFSSVTDEEAVPTEEDYKKYYEEHKAIFTAQEEIRDIEFVAFPIVPTQEDQAKIQQEVNKTWEAFQATSEEEIPFFVTDETENHIYDSTFVKASVFPAPVDTLIMKAGAGNYIEPTLVGNTWIMAKIQGAEMRPDSLRVSVLTILSSKAGGNITRTEEQAKSLADSVLGLVKGGLEFEKAVETYADVNKENGGDQGWQLDGAFGFLNNDILKTAVNGYFTYELPQGQGYYIVKVTGKTTPVQKYRVAMITRAINASETTEKNIYNTAAQFAGQNRTYAEMISAAQQQNYNVRADRLFAMSSSVAGLPNAREIVRWAYDEKTKVNAVADQVYNLQDMYVVVALKDIIKKGVVPFEQVRPMIENEVRLEKKAEVLLAKAKEAKTNDINAYAAKLNTTVDTINQINFCDNMEGRYFGKFGAELKVHSASAIAKQGTMVGPMKGAQGVYMVQVDNQTKVINNEEELNARTSAIRGQLMQQGSQRVQQMLLNVLTDKAKVVDQRHLSY